MVVPLEKGLLSAEARSLATDMDSAVRMRSSLISTAVGNSELDSFLEAGGLDKLLSALRKHFPDFLSVEVTNDRGQIQAMGGEFAPVSGKLVFKGLFWEDLYGQFGYLNTREVSSTTIRKIIVFLSPVHISVQRGVSGLPEAGFLASLSSRSLNLCRPDA